MLRTLVAFIHTSEFEGLLALNEKRSDWNC